MLFLVGVTFAYDDSDLFDEDLEDLFEVSPEEQAVIKEAIKQNELSDEEIKQREAEERRRKIEAMQEPIPQFDSHFDRYLWYANKYKIEAVLFGFALTFMFNFFLGKRVNFKLANAFHSRVIPTLNDNFAHLGFGQEGGLNLN